MTAGPSNPEPPHRLRIVDAHHHLWDLERTPAGYPWLKTPDAPGHMGPYHAICRSYLPEDYRRDTASVEIVKTVHVEAGRRPEETVDETEWVVEQANLNGWPNAIVAYVDLTDPGFEAVIEAHRAHSRLRGVRMRMTMGGRQLSELGPGDTLMSDTSWRRAYGRLARYGLSFELQAPVPVLADAAALARDYPAVPLVLTHAGFPFDRSAEGLAAWRAGLAELARAENVVAKISGIAMTDHNWTQARLAEIVTQLVDIFGPARTMFGTNFPVDTLYSAPERLLAAHLAALARYTPEEQEQVLIGTASRFYRV